MLGRSHPSQAGRGTSRTRDYFAALAESSGEFIAMWDLDLRPFYVNAAGLRMVGLSSLGDASRTTVSEFFFPEEQGRVVEEFFPLVRREGRGEIEIRFRHFLTGEAVWVITSAITLTDGHEHVTGYGTISRDITERKRSEQAIRETEAQFRTLADNMSQLAWMADQTGWIFWYNRRWYEYTGTTLEQMQGWGWRQVHHPEHVDRVVARIQRSWDTGEAWEDTFPLRGHDGRYRWFLSRALPIRDPSSQQVIQWFGTNTDITEQLEAEDALREANRRKDAFLATLAHELRNPLAPVRSSLEVLKGEPAAELSRQALDIMDRQVSLMQRLIDDLLDISRVDRNLLALRTERLDLGALVEQVVESCRPLAESGGQELVVNIPDEPLPMHADQVRLSQVFSNLLHNACKYTGAGGRIALTVTHQGGDAVVAVKDDGIGIPADMLPRVFEMFTQVDPTMERVRGGLGIGLTLVQQLVNLHGGRVAAASEGLGRGSEFTVRLPLARPTHEPAPAALPASPEPAGGHGPLRILIVDDNRDGADALAMLLRLEGHETQVVYDGFAALEHATRLRPDVMLLDIGMPRLNGLDVCRAIRAEPWGRHVTLVALTGWGQDTDRQRSASAGFDAHLVKPLDQQALSRLLAETATGGRTRAQ
ncbi:MAG: PAS domain S-box protein [Vicinamibacterales bacterium]